MLRRAAVLLLVGMVGLIAARGSASNGAGTTGCARPCDGGSPQSVVQHDRSMPTPCIRDVGCGGGSALGFGSAVAAVLLLAGATLGLGLGRWRRRGLPARLPLGRFTAGGLFRPPQVLLDV